MVQRYLISPLVIRYTQASQSVAQLSFLVEQDGLLVEQLVTQVHTPEWLTSFIDRWLLNGGEVIDLRYRTDRLTQGEIQEFVAWDSSVQRQAARNRSIAQKRRQSIEESTVIES